MYGHPALAGPLSWGVTARGGPARSSASSRCRRACAAPQRALLNAAFARRGGGRGHAAVKVTLESDLPAVHGAGQLRRAVGGRARGCCCRRRGEAPTPKDVARVALGDGAGVPRHAVRRGPHHQRAWSSSSSSAASRARRSARARDGEAARGRCKVLVALAGERSPDEGDGGGRCASGRRGGPSATRGCSRRLGGWPRRAREAVEAGDLEALGDAMNVNQGLLSALGLSSPPLEEMVHRLRALGALGAKLTGAGGDGGAVIGLFLEPEPRGGAAHARGRALLHQPARGAAGAVSALMKATALAHPNIALVKYWGKRDEALILPHQSSLSLTLAPLSRDDHGGVRRARRTRWSSTATTAQGSEREPRAAPAGHGARGGEKRAGAGEGGVARRLPRGGGAGQQRGGLRGAGGGGARGGGAARGHRGRSPSWRGWAAAPRAAASRAASARGARASARTARTASPSSSSTRTTGRSCAWWWPWSAAARRR